MAAKTKPNEIQINRLYDAPVKMVWEAWVDPKQVGKWWGPRGFTLTTKSKDVKPGGKWIYTMHGPDGVDWPNITLFHEVETYSKLVYDHGGNENQPLMFQVTVFFSEQEGKTKMEMTMAFPTAEIATSTKQFIKQANGDSTWDRLAEYLSQEKNQKDIFVINRSFQAPIQLTYEMFTEAKHFANWMPPTGATMEFLKTDIKVGGTSFYRMDSAHGVMFGKVNYKDFTQPNRLLYTQTFCDEKGNISRHPLAPTWPETMLTTITLTDEGPQQTRITIQWEVFGEATAIERETFHNAKIGMMGGWTGSFDKLENYLTQQTDLKLNPKAQAQ